MATANVHTETIVTLRVSEAEAKALAAILGAVGGDPVNSSRKHADSVARALREAGFPHIWLGEENMPFETQARSLIFKENN